MSNPNMYYLSGIYMHCTRIDHIKFGCFSLYRQIYTKYTNVQLFIASFRMQ